MTDYFKNECKNPAYKNRYGKLEFSDFSITNSDALSNIELTDSCVTNDNIIGTTNNKTLKFNTLDNKDLIDKYFNASVGVSYEKEEEIENDLVFEPGSKTSSIYEKGYGYSSTLSSGEGNYRIEDFPASSLYNRNKLYAVCCDENENVISQIECKNPSGTETTSTSYSFTAAKGTKKIYFIYYNYRNGIPIQGNGNAYITLNENKFKIFRNFIDVEYLPLGSFIVTKEDIDDTGKSSSYECDDYGVNLDKVYKCGISESKLPTATIRDFYIDACQQADLTPMQYSFTNYDIVVGGNPFTNNETIRTVISNVAQAGCYFVDIVGRAIYLKWFDTEISEIFDNSQYATLVKNQVFGPVNSIVIGDASVDGENFTKEDQASIAANGETQISIVDNYFLYNDKLRRQAMGGIYNKLNGFNYINYELTSYTGKPYLKRGNKISIEDMDGNYFESYVLSHTFTYNGSFKSVISAPSLSTTQQAIKNTQSISNVFRRTERKVDKINGIIEDVIEEQTDTNKKIVEVIETLDNINSKVEVLEHIAETNDYPLTTSNAIKDKAISLIVDGTYKLGSTYISKKMNEMSDKKSYTGSISNLIIDYNKYSNYLNFQQYATKSGSCSVFEQWGSENLYIKADRNYKVSVEYISGTLNIIKTASDYNFGFSIIDSNNRSYNIYNNGDGFNEITLPILEDGVYWKYINAIFKDSTYTTFDNYKIRLKFEERQFEPINAIAYINIDDNSIEYNLGDNWLGKYEDTYDILNITGGVITKRIGLNDDGEYYILEEPYNVKVASLDIPLEKGTNHVSISSNITPDNMTLKYKTTDIVDDMYVTGSQLDQTSTQIKAEVYQKVGEDYVTNSALDIKVGEIDLSVSKKVGDLDEKVTGELSLKVGKNENNQIVSMLNASADEITLAGGTKINLTTAGKLLISAGNFKLDDNGTVTCNNAVMNNITINSGIINLLSPRDYPASLHIDDGYGGSCNLTGYSYSLIKGSEYDSALYLGTDYVQILGADNHSSSEILISCSDKNDPRIYVRTPNNPKYNSEIHSTYIRATEYKQWSLESAKKDFEKFDSGLKIIKEADIYKYHFKSDNETDRKRVGLVIPDEGGDYKTPKEVISNDGQSIDIYSMVSVAWSAIKQLSEENEKMKEEIKKLKEVIDSE